ncbi:MAG TPA: PepSY-associated TM helix domain-containing protein [Chthoniobacteraceae bacterium]|nr:PepSY-associated TM helix domain-containing protein [Chthoniobacteraceae bacterium]
MRRILFWIHLLAGVVAGLVILVMSATGVALAYERQIIAFSERHYRATPEQVASAPRLSLNTLAESVLAQNEGEAPGSVNVSVDPAAPVAFSYGRQKTLYYNPYSGEYMGSGSAMRGVMRELMGWHRWLGSREVGRVVTGACNFAFVVLIVTGMVLWFPRRWPWNWNWRLLRPSVVFNRKLKGKARDWNWHNVIGLWSAPVLLILAATGTVWSYTWSNNLVYRLVGSTPPPPREGGGGPGGPGRPGGRERGAGERGGRGATPAIHVDLDAMVAAARTQTAGWQTISVQLPKGKAKTVSVGVSEKLQWNPNARGSLTLDAKTAAVVEWVPFMEQEIGRRARAMVRPIHTGEAGGLIGQTIAGLASAGGVVLVWTGLALTWRRFWSWKRRGSSAKPGTPKPLAKV